MAAVKSFTHLDTILAEQKAQAADYRRTYGDENELVNRLTPLPLVSPREREAFDRLFAMPDFPKRFTDFAWDISVDENGKISENKIRLFDALREDFGPDVDRLYNRAETDNSHHYGTIEKLAKYLALKNKSWSSHSEFVNTLERLVLIDSDPSRVDEIGFFREYAYLLYDTEIFKAIAGGNRAVYGNNPKYGITGPPSFHEISFFTDSAAPQGLLSVRDAAGTEEILFELGLASPVVSPALNWSERIRSYVIVADPASMSVASNLDSYADNGVNPFARISNLQSEGSYRALDIAAVFERLNDSPHAQAPHQKQGSLQDYIMVAEREIYHPNPESLALGSRRDVQDGVTAAELLAHLTHATRHHAVLWPDPFRALEIRQALENVVLLDSNFIVPVKTQDALEDELEATYDRINNLSLLIGDKKLSEVQILMDPGVANHPPLPVSLDKTIWFDSPPDTDVARLHLSFDAICKHGTVSLDDFATFNDENNRLVQIIRAAGHQDDRISLGALIKSRMDLISKYRKIPDINALSDTTNAAAEPAASAAAPASAPASTPSDSTVLPDHARLFAERGQTALADEAAPLTRTEIAVSAFSPTVAKSLFTHALGLFRKRPQQGQAVPATTAPGQPSILLLESDLVETPLAPATAAAPMAPPAAPPRRFPPLRERREGSDLAAIAAAASQTLLMPSPGTSATASTIPAGTIDLIDTASGSFEAASPPATELRADPSDRLAPAKNPPNPFAEDTDLPLPDFTKPATSAAASTDTSGPDRQSTVNLVDNAAPASAAFRALGAQPASPPSAADEPLDLNLYLVPEPAKPVPAAASVVVPLTPPNLTPASDPDSTTASAKAASFETTRNNPSKIILPVANAQPSTGSHGSIHRAAIDGLKALNEPPQQQKQAAGNAASSFHPDEHELAGHIARHDQAIANGEAHYSRVDFETIIPHLMRTEFSSMDINTNGLHLRYDDGAEVFSSRGRYDMVNYNVATIRAGIDSMSALYGNSLELEGAHTDYLNLATAVAMARGVTILNYTPSAPDKIWIEAEARRFRAQFFREDAGAAPTVGIAAPNFVPRKAAAAGAAP